MEKEIPMLAYQALHRDSFVTYSSAVGTQQIVGGVPKGTHSMVAIHPAITWLATLYSAYGITILHICIF